MYDRNALCDVKVEVLLWEELLPYGLRQLIRLQR